MTSIPVYLVFLGLLVGPGCSSETPSSPPGSAARAPELAPVAPAPEVAPPEVAAEPPEPESAQASGLRLPGSPPPPRLRGPPEGWVALEDAVAGVVLDIRYHTADNFTGAPLPGYGAPGAWLRTEVAAQLALVQQDLAPEGLGLIVYDAYRPVRGTQAMVAWATRTGNEWTLEQGYVASRSGHNKGHTVDLSLVRLETGEVLDMGTPWDTFSEASHGANATGQARVNRDRLAAAMDARGFGAYTKEWWHFRYPLVDPAPLDVPYGCFEPEEWVAPEGWAEPGYEPPATWPEDPCPAE